MSFCAAHITTVQFVEKLERMRAASSFHVTRVRIASVKITFQTTFDFSIHVNE
jgi:hypothetical protein